MDEWIPSLPAGDGRAERQRGSWDSNAAAWTEAIRRGRIDSRRVTDAALVAALSSHTPRRVLDLGCGEGWLGRELSTRGIDVVGVDACQALVASAREQGGGVFHTLDYARLVSCEPALLPAELRVAFDAVVANFSLLDEHIEGLLRRAGDWLAPQGTLVIQTLHPWASLGEGAYRSGWRQERFQAFGGDFPVTMPWYYRTLSDWLAVLASAGLTPVAIEEPRDPASGEPLSMLLHCGSTGKRAD